MKIEDKITTEIIKDTNGNERKVFYIDIGHIPVFPPSILATYIEEIRQRLKNGGCGSSFSL